MTILQTSTNQTPKGSPSTRPRNGKYNPELASSNNSYEDRSPILQRSQFARLLQRDGVNCLFHTINLQMVFGGPILRDLFEAFEKSTPTQAVIDQFSEIHTADLVKRVIADLSQSGLLVQNANADVSVYRKEYDKAISQYRIQLMYFLPTTACNFRCTYCFVEDEGRHQKPCFMDIPTAEMALTTFARLNKEAGHGTVIFYGGEPLLNPQTTFYSLRRLRQLEAESQILPMDRVSLLTNGSLVDEETIRVFKETRPTVSVSIDGPQRLHDAARVDEHGRGTFAAALKGYRWLQDAGLKPGISCTLSTATIEHMDEIVDFIISDLKPSGMGFNLPLPQTGNKGNSDFDHEFGVEQLIKAFVRLREAGIYEDRMMRRVRPFKSQQLHCKDCMGVGGQIVVTPAGRVGPCQAYLGVDDEKYFPLTVAELAAKGEQISAADIYSNPRFGEWCHRFPLNMKECADCVAISVCGGGCPYAADVTAGSIWQIDERVCHQAENILQWMIWDTYEHMQAS